MISPHTGKELELMLTGEKPVAMFCDILPHDGLIAEEVIPEEAFQPHVSRGTFIRTAQDFHNTANQKTVRYVCFARPQDQWRSECIMWLQQGAYSGARPETAETPLIMGRLLGYSEADIQDFIQNRKSPDEIHSLVA